MSYKSHELPSGSLKETETIPERGQTERLLE